MEPETIIELPRGGFGHGIECLPKQALTEKVLPHRLHTLAQDGVTVHECAVCVLAPRIVLEDERRILDR
jgi:hypothetical protein